jgi:hypothetical protein
MAGAIFVALGFIGLAFRQDREQAGQRVESGTGIHPNRTAKGYAGIRICRSQGEGGMTPQPLSVPLRGRIGITLAGPRGFLGGSGIGSCGASGSNRVHSSSV